MTERARTATDADLGELVRLANEALASIPTGRGGDVVALRDLRSRPVAPSLRSAVHDPEALVVVGLWHEATVGYLVAHLEHLQDRTTLAVIDDLWVEVEARGVGVGEVMFLEALEWARAQGCRGIDAMALPGDRNTKNFFERFGLVARAIVVHRSLLAPPAPDSDAPAGDGE